MNRLVVAILTCLLLSVPAQAATRHGSWSYVPAVAGIPMRCTDHAGQSVAMVVNNRIAGVGRAYPGLRVIQMNRKTLDNLPPAAALFWYVHECGHHALAYPHNTSESASDCWAVKALRGLGLIHSQDQLQQLVDSITPLAGSHAHLPGHERGRLIMQCWNGVH